MSKKDCAPWCPEVYYFCWWKEWDGFMDGELVVGDLRFNYDFVTESEDPLGDADHVLTNFSEEGARIHFAAHGIHNIDIVYDREEL